MLANFRLFKNQRDHNTYSFSKVYHCLDYIWYALLLVQVLDGKQVLFWYAVASRCLDEGLNVCPLVVFCPWLLDLGDRAWLEGIYDSAKEHTIAKQVVKIFRWNRVIENGLNPESNLRFDVLVALAKMLFSCLVID